MTSKRLLPRRRRAAGRNVWEPRFPRAKVVGVGSFGRASVYGTEGCWFEPSGVYFLSPWIVPTAGGGFRKKAKTPGTPTPWQL
jgi:hypothetical protein